MNKISRITISNTIKEKFLIFNRLIKIKKEYEINHVFLFKKINNNINIEIKNKIIKTLLPPTKDVLTFYRDLINSDNIFQSSLEILNLCEKIVRKLKKNEKIILIGIARSGIIPAYIIKNVLSNIYKINIFKLIILSPNFIDESYLDKFKEEILKSNAVAIFIDGWCSKGTTYKIIKQKWRELFSKRKFYFCVITSFMPIKEEFFIYSTNKDILFPWVINQTNTSGLSAYFLDNNNKSCAFYLPPKLRLLDPNIKIYLNFIEKINHNFKIKKEKLNCIKKIYSDNFIQQLIKTGYNIKLGINECIKGLDKGTVKKLFITNKISYSNKYFLERYCSIQNIKPIIIKTKSDLECFFIKNRQKKI